jgi:hypothetical protein
VISGEKSNLLPWGQEKGEGDKKRNLNSKRKKQNYKSKIKI